MFKKSSLGLGTKIGAAANKPDLNSYLKNLKKKQKELSRKHSGGSTDRDQAAEQIKDETEEEEEEEDSDLASIAREFQDNDDDDLDPIFDSPFIKKPNQPKVRHASDNTTPLPERKFSFISSAPKESDKDPDESPIHNASKALDKFMKFDQKYSSFKSLKKPDSFEDTEEDSEPITGKMDKTPSPINSGKSRLRRLSEKAGLTLDIPDRKKSGESTLSEVSDHYQCSTPNLTHSPRSPKSPMSPIFSLENLHDIEELMDETGPPEADNELAVDVQDKYFKFESPAPDQMGTKKQIVVKSDKNSPNIFRFGSAPPKIESTSEDNKEEVIVTDDEDVDEQFIEYELTAEDEPEDSNVQDSVIDEPQLATAMKNLEASEKKELSNKHLKSKNDVSQTTSDTNHDSSSINTSSSTLKSSSKKSKRKKGRHKKSSRSKSCYYCENVCEYHMEKIKQKQNNGSSKTGSSKKKRHKDIEEKVEKKLEKEMINESVQVGNPNAKYGHGHYLFDPTQDALYNPEDTGNMAFIKTVWQNDIKSQMKVQKEAQQTLENHKNPMAYALSELMKGQLELTAHFLSSQKSLYANYCGNLEKILQEPSKPNHNDFEKVIHAKRYRESHDKKIKNHHRRKKETKEVVEEEEPTAEITYESEFESEESENESDSNVLTEISAATETNE